MKFEFGKQVHLGAFTRSSKMFAIMHKEKDDGTVDVLLVHGAKGPHKGVLCSVVPINMPAEVFEEMPENGINGLDP